jgi:hypothetical protein
MTPPTSPDPTPATSRRRDRSHDEVPGIGCGRSSRSDAPVRTTHPRVTHDGRRRRGGTQHPGAAVGRRGRRRAGRAVGGRRPAGGPAFPRGGHTEALNGRRSVDRPPCRNDTAPPAALSLLSAGAARRFEQAGRIPDQRRHGGGSPGRPAGRPHRAALRGSQPRRRFRGTGTRTHRTDVRFRRQVHHGEREEHVRVDEGPGQGCHERSVRDAGRVGGLGDGPPARPAQVASRPAIARIRRRAGISRISIKL